MAQNKLLVIVTIKVRSPAGKNLFLNELEIVREQVGTAEHEFKDYIYANSFQNNFIYKIDKETGDIVKQYDMSELDEKNRRVIESKGE